MTRGHGVCLGGALGVVLALAAISPAAAQSELRASVPADDAVLACPPAAIELQFNETVQLTALRLYRADGAEIALPRRPIQESRREIIDLPALEPGGFRAEWRIISADGHAVGGAIDFQVSGACRP